MRDFNPMEMHRMEAIFDSIEHTAKILDKQFPVLQDKMAMDHWLHVIWALQCEYNVDIRKIFKFAFKQERLDMIDFEDLPRKALGRKDATF